MDKPLILVTNDDGIQSHGLWAAVEAVLPHGEVLVVAPDRQWSGGGRSMPPNVSGMFQPQSRLVNGEWVSAYAVDASPALAVVHGIIEFAQRVPSLVVSGINYGANVSTEVTISGTVGAALEAGAFGIPALAVSLEMASKYHYIGDATTDYSAAMSFTQRFAEYLLSSPPMPDMDALNLNIPSDATPSTTWRFTRLSRRRYFLHVAPNRTAGGGRPGYKQIDDLLESEPDSDIRALGERVVSVTPLSLDLSSRIDWAHFESPTRNPAYTLPFNVDAAGE